MNTITSGYYAKEYYLLKEGSCLVLHIILVCINIYYLLPYFFKKRKYFEYIVIGFFQEVLFSLYTWYIFQVNLFTFETEGIFPYMINFTIFNSALLATAIGIKLFKIWYYESERNRRIEAEKLKSEIQFLKNQINPHTLFNSLNTILVMHQVNHVDTEKTILELSDILKYQLYDSSKDKVSLKKELEYIYNFVDIERTKKEGLQINWLIELEPSDYYIQIEPLLFTAFVENAFKHIRKNDVGEYFIDLQISKTDLQLLFEVKNSKLNSEVKAEVGGIGLENLKKRLNLIYPNKHKLTCQNFENVYIATLELTLL